MNGRSGHFSKPEFINNILKQDSLAITELVEAYSDHLFKACLGMGFAEDHAKEICHATWATFFEVVPNFKGGSHIRTFLFGILYNKVHEHRRTQKKHESYDPIEESFESEFLEDGHWMKPPTDPSKYCEDIELMKVIEKCLEHLPLNQRSAFTLKVVLEHDSEEICNELDISSTNLRQLLFRGKARLKKCIDNQLKG